MLGRNYIHGLVSSFDYALLALRRAGSVVVEILAFALMSPLPSLGASHDHANDALRCSAHVSYQEDGPNADLIWGLCENNQSEICLAR